MRFAYELGALGGPLSGRGDAGGGGTTRRGYRAVRGGQEPGPQANSHASGTGDYHGTTREIGQTTTPLCSNTDFKPRRRAGDVSTELNVWGGLP